VAADFVEIVGKPYGSGKVTQAAQDVLLGQVLIRALRAFFANDTPGACRQTPPERQEDLFKAVRAQLDPPQSDDPSRDPGAFFDARQWDFERMPVRDPHEIFVRLELIVTHAVTVEQGFAAEDMTLLDAALAVVELRKRSAAHALVPQRHRPEATAADASAKQADIAMLAGE
jgi:hypothetical protein